MKDLDYEVILNWWNSEVPMLNRSLIIEHVENQLGLKGVIFDKFGMMYLRDPTHSEFLSIFKELKKLKSIDRYEYNYVSSSLLALYENIEELVIVVEGGGNNDLEALSRLKYLKKLKIKGLSRLAGLHKLLNLEELNVTLEFKNGVNDLYLIEFLQNLKILHIHNEGWYSSKIDLKHICSLKSLKKLRVEGFYYDDVSPLRSLHNLESLVLGRNCFMSQSHHDFDGNILDISSLASLNLRKLWLAKELRVRNFSPIYHMLNLEFLSITYQFHAGSQKLNFISKFKKLEVLQIIDSTIDGLNINDVNSLTSLINLKAIHVENYSKIANIKFLESMKYLEYCYLDSVDRNLDMNNPFLINFEIELGSSGNGILNYNINHEKSFFPYWRWA